MIVVVVTNVRPDGGAMQMKDAGKTSDISV